MGTHHIDLSIRCFHSLLVELWIRLSLAICMAYPSRRTSTTALLPQMSQPQHHQKQQTVTPLNTTNFGARSLVQNDFSGRTCTAFDQIMSKISSFVLTCTCHCWLSHFWVQYSPIYSEYMTYIHYIHYMLNMDYIHICVSLYYPFPEFLTAVAAQKRPWMYKSSRTLVVAITTEGTGAVMFKKPRELSQSGQKIILIGYGSIPINTIFSGMNIHLPAILMFTRGTRFWHTANSA